MRSAEIERLGIGDLFYNSAGTICTVIAKYDDNVLTLVCFSRGHIEAYSSYSYSYNYLRSSERIRNVPKRNITREIIENRNNAIEFHHRSFEAAYREIHKENKQCK